ncbi:DNA polymerase III subunit chi [Thauera sp. WH-2]|jgi:DNA polymerase-3 subunit chi|uniref:DNA polymerase III subunit chi n=1 Tax=unclassified Thauera TaxID=2609274 RepID=UPI002A3A2792|nr:DNA polymerase III subunit chi [Thauera sp.]
MAARVHFYHNTPDRLALACELVANAHGRSRKVAVRCTTPEQLRTLDKLLWTAEPLSFIPHVPADHALASETPVTLACAGEAPNWPHGDVLLNLSDDLPAEHDAFRMVVEIVGHDAAERHAARQRWMRYRELGCELKAFDAERREAL